MEMLRQVPAVGPTWCGAAISSWPDHGGVACAGFRVQPSVQDRTDSVDRKRTMPVRLGELHHSRWPVERDCSQAATTSASKVFRGNSTHLTTGNSMNHHMCWNQTCVDECMPGNKCNPQQTSRRSAAPAPCSPAVAGLQASWVIGTGKRPDPTSSGFFCAPKLKAKLSTGSESVHMTSKSCCNNTWDISRPEAFL